MDALKRLQANIRAAEKDLQAAMKQDLNKSGFESYMAEIGMVLDEVGHAIKKMPGWAKPKRARTPMSQFAAKSFILSEPYGVTLVMAPWNYPFLLSMDPVIGAVAAGNCVVLKPSAYAPATSAAMAKLIADTFDPGWVTVCLLYTSRGAGDVELPHPVRKPHRREIGFHPFNGHCRSPLFYTSRQALALSLIHICGTAQTPATTLPTGPACGRWRNWG